MLTNLTIVWLSNRVLLLFADYVVTNGQQVDQARAVLRSDRCSRDL